MLSTEEILFSAPTGQFFLNEDKIVYVWLGNEDYTPDKEQKYLSEEQQQWVRWEYLKPEDQANAVQWIDREKWLAPVHVSDIKIGQSIYNKKGIYIGYRLE